MQFPSWRWCLIVLGLVQVPLALAQTLVGGVFEHVVRPGESLTLIAPATASTRGCWRGKTVWIGRDCCAPASGSGWTTATSYHSRA